MIEPYIGTIILWAGTYVPQGWALCNGQSMSLQQYTALYSLVGTVYGGDGQNTFNLPDLRNRVPISALNENYNGQHNYAPNASSYLPDSSSSSIISSGTVATGALNMSNLPQHTHTATFQPSGAGTQSSVPVAIPINTQTTSSGNPSGAYLAPIIDNTATGSPATYENSSNGTMASFPVSQNITGIAAPQIINSTTGYGTAFSFPVSGLVTVPVMPYVSLSYIIALEGYYPPRP
ncbi:MAG: phage tail protein [Mucilaginibacter sp.]